MTIYDGYAHVYDASGQLSFSLRMIGYLERLRERHPVPGERMLELACGTGTVAIALAQAGWQVVGVDGSAQMLAHARAKEGGDLPNLTWMQQDMRVVHLPERVHMATCLYDSLNYMLVSQDLAAVFRRVYEALLPGGAFFFDMNTAYAFVSFWDGDTYFTDDDDLAVVMESEYDDLRQRTTVHVTCFQREGELYRKLTETHTEQAYPPEQVATLLADVGFRVEASYECFTFLPPGPNTSRILWVARKPDDVAEGEWR